MLIKVIALNTSGYVKIEVEGFFIQRFINMCVSKGVYLDNIKHINQSKIICRTNKNDFRSVCKISKKTKCKIKIIKKGGIPFFVHRYRKRKIFLVLLLIIFILIFTVTQFIWNIEIIGDESVDRQEILELLNNNNIKVGTAKKEINVDKITNQIRYNRNDISWVGAKIKGTNFILELVKAEEKPEIIDESKITNIISNKTGVITRICVESGTAKVNVGDEVNKDDVLVEGVMEGKYTGVRYVNSRADIYAKVTYSKEESKKLEEYVNIQTGNEYNNYKIIFNNFKINLNKGVSKFKNYDTIETKNKFRLFSNYYMPIEFEKITYKEMRKEIKKYTVEEITNELKTKLKEEILLELNNNYEQLLDCNSNVNIDNNNIIVNVNCIVEEKIGTSKDLVF